MDLSFISVEKVIPNLMKFCHSGTEWITLIKPQFEVGKGKVGKGGIVRSESDRLEVVSRIRRFIETNGMDWAGLIDSPITGTQGNIEFLSHWKIKK
jgi:23S rRNA (cytidine1920-2'-O)/16S rRNA (cytidine1409-2'-O)-methyltransferase